MGVTRNIGLIRYYFVVFAWLGAIDVAESFLFQFTSPSPTTTTLANPNEAPWATKARWIRKKDGCISGRNDFNRFGARHPTDSITPTRIGRNSRLEMASPTLGNDDGNNDGNGSNDNVGPLVRFALFAGIGVLYWYLLVLGAAANANGLFVPDFIPMVPGWPVSDSDLAPVLEDSYHFFYLSDLLQNPDAPYVSPPRLAVFNLVEAWIFAMLPVLWRDGNRRLPRPVLLVSWLALGINLTNAFLAPYLAITELRGTQQQLQQQRMKMDSSSSVSVAAEVEASMETKTKTEPNVEKNPFVSGLFALVAIAVVGHAVSESVTVATNADWADFVQLAKTDRSYLAFCIDPILFALFQPFLLARIKNESDPRDCIPFVGLMLWLLLDEKEE